MSLSTSHGWDKAGGGRQADTPPPPLPQSLPGRAAGVGLGGLVPSSTSDTPPSGLFVVDRHEARLKRLRRSVLTTARLQVEELEAGKTRHHAVMVTLTYRPGVEWCPYQITKYLKAVRQWCRRRGADARYLWVHELTKAGKTHYHVLFWLPKALQMPKADKQGWWPHGMTKTEAVRRSAVAYVAKYASKGTDDKLPKGCRLTGSGGLNEDSRSQRAWWACPGYVREWCEDYTLCPRRCPGGGWVAKASGDYLPAQFEVVCLWPLTVRRISETAGGAESLIR